MCSRCFVTTKCLVLPVSVPCGVKEQALWTVVTNKIQILSIVQSLGAENNTVSNLFELMSLCSVIVESTPGLLWQVVGWSLLVSVIACQYSLFCCCC